MNVLRFAPSAADAEKLRDGAEEREERIGEDAVDGEMDGRADERCRPDDWGATDRKGR